MITRYRDYLEFLDKELSKMFESQKQFIKCQKGCAYCCKEGEFPISELEYVNLMFYYNELPNEIKDKINENISNLLAKPREKLYECPFLINDICSVYPARSIICRAFGLLSYNEKHKKRIPFCVDLGLNYANVYDEKSESIKENYSGKIEPVAYNIDRHFLRSKRVENSFDIFFGEDKPLVEWLQEEFNH